MCGLMIDRYISQEMKELFTDESRFNSYLKIEIEATHAFVKLGISTFFNIGIYFSSIP